MNTIEDNEDRAVRGLLNTAFGAEEPPFADLASGSIARGDAARRRNRLFTASGVALSVVAVVGTFAVVNSAAPTPGSRPTQTAATPTPAPPDLPPTSAHGLPTVAKNLDLLARVPGVLQPLLPQGATVSAPTRDYGPMTSGPGFLLNRQTGTTLAHLQLGTAPSDPKNDQIVGCSQGWSCQTRQVAGGTVYVQAASFTAERQVGDYEAKALKPGTEKTVVGKSAILTFIPADRTKPTFSITETTGVAALQFRDKPPTGWIEEGNPWPPTQYPPKQPFDTAGVLVSMDDFAAIVTNPGLDKLEKEMDPGTPVSQDTVKMLAEQASQVATAGAGVVPAGTKLSLDLTQMSARLLLTGATGSNEITWRTTKQDPAFVSQTFGFRAPNVDTTTTPVAGGKLLTWVQYPTTSNMVKTSSTPSAYDYYFFPTDTTKPAVIVELKTNDSMTGNASPVQLTADQFLTLAANPQLQTAVDKTTAVVSALQ